MKYFIKTMANVQSLQEQVTELLQRIDVLVAKVAVLEENQQLKAENIDLKKRLSCHETPKDSHNSHMPPSSDLPRGKALRKTNSLREKSGKTRWSNRARRDNVNCVGFSRPCCVSFSQLLPLLLEWFIDHRRRWNQSTSGNWYSTPFVQLSQSTPGYLNNVLADTAFKANSPGELIHTPFTEKIFTLGQLIWAFVSIYLITGYSPCLPICSIFISHKEPSPLMLNHVEVRSESAAYELIRQHIEQSPVNGADETGANINGKLHWAWTWQNPTASYFYIHPSRGKTAIESAFPNGLPKSILSTDCWSSYFGMEVENHQICTAHLLRELIYLKEHYPEQNWGFKILYINKRSPQAIQNSNFCFR